MTDPVALPFRQIHLDFHTSPAIPDVGAAFDADAFAETMRRAHVNSVTVFAKCHHGHLYYETFRPERHPSLQPGAALLEQQVEALHTRGIRAPIYLSVQCDEYAANTHPDWVARAPNGSQVKGGGQVFSPGWQILDLSSPYQDFLAEQTLEVLNRFDPVDGIFFDMCWDQPSTTQWAIDAMRRTGLDPERDADRNRHARNVAQSFMRRFHRLVKDASPNATVYFNARPLFCLNEDVRHLAQIEIEALPTGGWGYLYFPINVRYARTFDKPYMGMTARFHKSWADFGGLKPTAALEYETSQMIAHGARCSIGDQLHPRGTTDPAAYERIGKVYQRIAEREEWLTDARSVVEAGVFQRPTGVLGTTQTNSDTDVGATRMLQQLQVQFNFIDPSSDLSPYRLLILPDSLVVDPALRRKLAAFMKRGGAIIATGTSGLDADAKRVCLPGLPVNPAGFSPYTSTYLRFAPRFADGIPPTDHIVYDRGVRVRPRPGAKIVASVVEPYFERAWDHFCSHQQTPGDRVTDYAAAVIDGRTAYISFPIFEVFAKHGNVPYRLLVQKCLGGVLPHPLTRAEGAPLHTEIALTDQPAQGRRIAHLLYYTPVRVTPTLDLIEDIVPVRRIRLAVRVPRRPQRVYLAPSRRPLAFQYDRGVATLTLPELRGHAMVVCETR